MICIAAAGKTIVLAASAFTLSWTHSVEKTRWEERWLVEPGGLTVVEGRIEGSGAGMDPPPDAVLDDGAYVYRPDIAPLKQLILAASGATVSGWTLCPEGGQCIELGATRGEPIVIEECDGDDEARAREQQTGVYVQDGHTPLWAAAHLPRKGGDYSRRRFRDSSNGSKPLRLRRLADLPPCGGDARQGRGGSAGDNGCPEHSSGV